MSRPEPFPKMTFEEFLAWEEEQDVRHEYIAGEVYTMAGGSKDHNRITLNIASRLLAKFEDSHCRVYAENILLRMDLGDAGIGYYPDVMVVCDPNDAPREAYAEKPCALFEVLSDSTQPVDRGDKLRDYKTLPSLKLYVLVSQQGAQVTVYRRDNQWRPVTLNRADDTIVLDCLPDASTTLTLAEIYRGLGFHV